MKLHQPVPILRMLDEAKAREFYVDFLGFSIDWEHRFDDDAPLYLQISRDGCTIHLSEHYEDCTPGGALRIETDDVDTLNREMLQKNYKYAKLGLNDTTWRTREMSLTDPFGNRVTFYQRLDRTGSIGEQPPRDGMTPAGGTSRWVAANRALETEGADPLYRDPFARELAGASGFAMMASMRAALGHPNSAAPDPYLTIRTKFLDDAVLRATRESAITQIVIVAAGMDSRAFRLNWSADVVLYEIDRDDVFDHKEAVLQRLNPSPGCVRRVVRADLSQPWTGDLIKAGFDTHRPAMILVEGLFMYLAEAVATRLLKAIATIASVGSVLGLDVVDTQMLVSPYTAAYLSKLAELGCPWRFGVDYPEHWLAEHGWNANVVSPGDPGANFGRWPFPVMPRSFTGMPRSYLVLATREAQPPERV